MKHDLDYIEFEMDGQEVSIDFNQPRWSDNDNNFMRAVSGYYIDHNGKPVYYKDDLID